MPIIFNCDNCDRKEICQYYVLDPNSRKYFMLSNTPSGWMDVGEGAMACCVECVEEINNRRKNHIMNFDLSTFDQYCGVK